MRYYLYLLKFLTISIISLFLFAAGASHSFAFTAETVGNFGDVTVIGVEGDYGVQDLNCTGCNIPRQIISKEFFTVDIRYRHLEIEIRKNDQKIILIRM